MSDMNMDVRIADGTFGMVDERIGDIMCVCVYAVVICVWVEGVNVSSIAAVQLQLDASPNGNMDRACGSGARAPIDAVLGHARMTQLMLHGGRFNKCDLALLQQTLAWVKQQQFALSLSGLS